MRDSGQDRQTCCFTYSLSVACPTLKRSLIQQRVIAARKQGRIGDTLLLLEHPPVITLGRNASRANILVSDEWLASRGVELHEVNRGGDVTYHGPGQLVGYPIVDLRGEWPGKRGPHLGPVDFVRLLEEALIRTCADFGVMAKRIPKCTGVWTLGGGPTRDDKTVTNGAPNPSAMREKKLAAIGVHVSQAVTSHGFALNVTTDLGDFDWIVPCGIRDRRRHQPEAGGRCKSWDPQWTARSTPPRATSAGSSSARCSGATPSSNSLRHRAVEYKGRK